MGRHGWEAGVLLFSALKSIADAKYECRDVVLGEQTITIRVNTLIWDALATIANAENATLEDVIGCIASAAGSVDLATAIENFAMAYFREKAANCEPPGTEVSQARH